MITIDGNEAASYIAYRLSEVIAIYPITPSSAMGEWADVWSAQNKKNIWGTVPSITEMQSEGGAAAAIHGAMQAGSLTSTFTASQGLLLMIPTMFKVAGELTPTVFHISARTVATHALSIFGDHSDVMATRQTGFGMLCSNSVQEVMDMALISHASTLRSRIPFLHFFDGFRTSHEVCKISEIPDDQIMKLIGDKEVFEHRDRALSPDKPVIRGTAQNPDVFFQAREACNSFYLETPDVVQNIMDEFEKVVGRRYNLFDYVGDPKAEKIIILMGSGAETVHQTVDYLTSKGEKVGMIKVRLYRPFSIKHFIKALPKTVKSIAVLDRTKEPGALGEPLYQDIITALEESFYGEDKLVDSFPTVVGGRYGLSSKEFTPGMVKAVFDNLDNKYPRNHFTIGINDDVTKTSLTFDEKFSIEPENVFRGIFWGLGADGTVSANKNSIKIIGGETDNNAQGFFVYDSKKSGSYTTSHLRFGEEQINSPYLINSANFIACHQYQFVETYDILGKANEGAIFLLNSPYGKDEAFSKLPTKLQQEIIDKKIKFYVINAYTVASEAGMGQRINTIMQTCFFAISGILPRKEAIGKIKQSIEKTFGRKGEEIVQKNYEAVDATLAHLEEVEIPSKVSETASFAKKIPEDAPEFVKTFTAQAVAGKGDQIPVSMLPKDGTFPVGTTKYEKRNIADIIPVWESDICIQCGKCAMICPHACIRSKAYPENELKDAPETFKSVKMKGKDLGPDAFYTIQVGPEDCTGCEVCVQICPAKDRKNPERKAINMAPQRQLVAKEIENWDFFLKLPEADRTQVKANQVKGSQLLEPLFEFSGACAGCGETPYVKLATQLFGDRMLIGNATGCSSIYGGNLPTTPYTTNNDGRGPTWCNSLFEDNAEFALGFRLAVDKKKVQAEELIKKLSGTLGDKLVSAIIDSKQDDEAEIAEQRKRVDEVKKKLANGKDSDAAHLLTLADYLVKKSVWAMGGDGWAYDIGYGGLDHVLASGKNINILVMDTEVYSNTGGQMSKATPIGAIAKFAESGKPIGKKDLGLIAMAYGHVYVAKVAIGANDTHTLKAFIEAEKYDGPSLIIAYSPCIAHGYNLKSGLSQTKMAVDSGHWHLYRYNPMLSLEGKNPFQLDSKAPKVELKDYMNNENRFKALFKMNADRAESLAKEGQKQAEEKYKYYSDLSNLSFDKEDK